MYINGWVFEIHNSHIKLLLLSMWYDCLLVAVFQFDFSLMKIFHSVDYWYVFAVCNGCSDIDLNWHEISIADYYFVQFFDVDYGTFLSDRFFIFDDDFSNHKNEIFEKNEISDSFHFFLLMQFIKNLVHERAILDFKRINSIDFQMIGSIEL